MSEVRRKRQPWLTVLIVLVLAVVVGQAAYLFYLQRQVVSTLNGVYGELAASPELDALLDLNASLQPAETPTEGEAVPVQPSPNLNESVKNLEGLLGPDSSGTIKQLMDMTRQLAETYDVASGITPTPKPQPREADGPSGTVHVPDMSLAETEDAYRLKVDFGNVHIAHLTAEAENQTLHVKGNASAKAQQPFECTVALNARIDPDSLTMANEGNVYTVTVQKKSVVT